MAAESSDLTERINQICAEMGKTRYELHRDMQGTVAGLRSLSDIRSYVRSAPWLAMAGASVLGYLLVPSSGEADRTVVVREKAVPEPKKRRFGILGDALSLLTPLAIRYVQNRAVMMVDSMTSPANGSGGASTRPPASSSNFGTSRAYTRPDTKFGGR